MSSTGDSQVMQISEEFKNFIKELGKSDTRFVLQEGGNIKEVNRVRVKKLGVTTYRAVEGKYAERMNTFKILANTIEDVKRDLEEKKAYERIGDLTLGEDEKSSMQLGTSIKPKSMIRPDSVRPSIVRKSISEAPGHYFQFFKQIIRKTKIDFDNRRLKLNNMPITVVIKAKLVKIHYLFQMLGVSLIYVVNYDGQ